MSTALGCALLAYLNVQGHQARLAWVRAVEKAGLTARLDYNIWLVGLPSWLQAPLVQRLLAREIAIVEVNGQDDLTKLITCKRPSAVRTCVYMLALVSFWGLRLAVYLLWRKWGEEEDRRYAAMRLHHGEQFWWISLFSVFLLQGLLMWIISFPLQVAAAHDTLPFPRAIDILGLVIWVTGFFFECVGDAQLAIFTSDPGEQRAGPGPRPLAADPSPELLRRIPDVLGPLHGEHPGRGNVDDS